MKALGAVVVAAIVVLAALLLGRAGLLALALVVGVAATGELLRLARTPAIRPAALPALGGTVALMIVAHARDAEAPRWFPLVVAGVFSFAVADLLARRERPQVTRSIAYTVLPVLLVGMLGSYLLALRGMEDGFRLVLVLVLMVAASEGAVVVLRSRGVRAEPTWQRFAASGAGTVVVAIVAAVAFAGTFGWMSALALAALVALATPLGGLVAEMIEDDLVRLEPGVRRAGASLLRAIDGLLVSAPAFFYTFRLLAG